MMGRGESQVWLIHWLVAQARDRSVWSCPVVVASAIVLRRERLPPIAHVSVA